MRPPGGGKLGGWIDDRGGERVAIDPVAKRPDIAGGACRRVEPGAEQRGFFFGHQQAQLGPPRHSGLVGGKQASLAGVDRLVRLTGVGGVSFELG